MEEITNTVTRLAKDVDEEGRKKLADGLRDLSFSLETPHDTLQRIMFMVGSDLLGEYSTRNLLI